MAGDTLGRWREDLPFLLTIASAVGLTVADILPRWACLALIALLVLIFAFLHVLCGQARGENALAPAAPVVPFPAPDPRVEVIRAYNSDTIEGLLWLWKWGSIDLDSPWLGRIVELTPHCPVCEAPITPMHLPRRRGIYGPSGPPQVVFSCRVGNDFSLPVTDRWSDLESIVRATITHRARQRSEAA